MILVVDDQPYVRKFLSEERETALEEPNTELSDTSNIKSEESPKVLFVCRHNSARSQMAEAFLNQLGGERFEAESAGLRPKKILPSAAAVMQEMGLDISERPTRSVYDLHKNGFQYDYVITVCDEASSKKCPNFKRPCRYFHWSFPEPSKFKGNQEEIIEQTRRVRDQIRSKILEWVAIFNPEDLTDA
jgi:arsenate reductase